ncbi:hypothetical protein HY522_10370 [bacterium]|nr:hypothetical protein [bacterium]
MKGNLTKVEGVVEVQKAGTSEWVEAQAGMDIGPGDQVAAGIDGRATMAFANSQTDIAPLAQFAVGRAQESDKVYQTEIFLQVGKLTSKIDKQSGKANRFTVTTPASVAGIRGTTLETEYTPGLGAVNRITEGAGFVAPVQAERLPPAVQQILNIAPPPAAREAAAKAAEKAGAPAAIVAQIAAGLPPTTEARQIMAQVAAASGAGPGAVQAIQQGFASVQAVTQLFEAASNAGLSVGQAGPEVAGPAVGGLAPEAAPIGPMDPSVLGPADLPVFDGLPDGPSLLDPAAVDPSIGPVVELGNGDRDFQPTLDGPGRGQYDPDKTVGDPGGFPPSPGEEGDPFGDPSLDPQRDPAPPPEFQPPPVVSGGDADGDGIPDDWERENGLNPLDPRDAQQDPDRDGWDNLTEFHDQTNPRDPTSHGVTLASVGSGAEDYDGDGLPNFYELQYGLDPNNPADALLDADGDGLSNLYEFQNSLDPLLFLDAASFDADGDGLPDYYELQIGLNPNSAADALLDPDGDGFTSLQEFQSATDPFDAISVPVAEATTTQTPVGASGPGGYADMDGDGIPDFWESVHSMNLSDPNDGGLDLDGDGFTNLAEFQFGSDPLNPLSFPPDLNGHGDIVTINVYTPDPGVYFDQYADAYIVYYSPDKAGTVTGNSGFETSGPAGFGYVNVGGTVPTGYPEAGATIVDVDGDGHSPMAAFSGTVFYDANDADFTSPAPQSGAAVPFDQTSWLGNPNPFHH